MEMSLWIKWPIGSLTNRVDKLEHPCTREAIQFCIYKLPMDWNCFRSKGLIFWTIQGSNHRKMNCREEEMMASLYIHALRRGTFEYGKETQANFIKNTIWHLSRLSLLHACLCAQTSIISILVARTWIFIWSMLTVESFW